jgi:hypothetical protein
MFVCFMCSVNQSYHLTMANNDVIFRVHYGGRFDRRYKCTYVGGQIGLYEESYDLDCLSFFEIETMARKFGYQPGDLVYYRIPERELDDGLVLLPSDEDVVRMAEVLLGHTLVVLYTVSFADANADAKVGANEGKDVAKSGNEEMRMKVINDLYWQALMSDDDDAWDGADEPEAGTSKRDNDYIPDFDDEGDTDEEDGSHEDGSHEEGSHEMATDVGGASGSATMFGRMLDDEEKDEVSSNLARSDILVTPPKSDEEYEASSWPKCVTRTSQFQDVDMEDPHLDVGMSFESAAQFRKAMREYNLFRVRMLCSQKMMGTELLEFVRVGSRVVLGEFMVHWLRVRELLCLSH